MGQNQTAGLFGGLLIVTALVVGAVWIMPGTRAWLAAQLGGTPAAEPGVSIAAPNAGSFGTYTALPASTTVPYQLGLNPNGGISIITAAQLPANETPSIALPQLAPLAPTSAGLAFA